MKRIALLTTFLVALFTISFAQDKPLTGIWELKKTKNGQGNLLDVPIGAYKLFTNDGKFSNMRITQNGAILTHGGIFKIDSNNNYIENVQDNIVSSKLEKLQTKLTVMI